MQGEDTQWAEGLVVEAVRTLDGGVVRETVEAALSLEGVDQLGLTNLDHRYLKTIIEFYNGGPVGLETIATTLNEESDTLVDMIEPYLLKIGMIQRTRQGRVASTKAYEHLGLKKGGIGDPQESLF